MTLEDTATTILLVSPRGITHDALRALLNSQPNVEIVGSANGGISAFVKFLQNEAQLLVVDSGFPLEEVVALIRRVKTTEPKTRCLALTVNRNDHTALVTAGADVVLPRNSSSRKFAEAIAPLRQEA